MATMNDEKYNEFKVSGHIDMRTKKFIIDRKEPTERGHVMITARDADNNNAQTRFNFLHYEKVKEPVKKTAKK
jgi:hypothetical protein